jgi:aldose sugar dehydrogenase
LYATEHGPAGNDEVNLIEPGQNYGWPQAQGENHAPPFRAPLVMYGATIAPCGATWYNGDAIPQWRGSLLFGALRGTHLHRLSVAPDDPTRVATDERLYDGEYGRLRDIAQGPDGALYLLTSNRDGRGSPHQDDDRLLRISGR